MLRIFKGILQVDTGTLHETPTPVLSLSLVTNTDTNTNPHAASLHCVGPIEEEEHPTLARTLVRQQFEAFSTVTFEAANGVPAVVVTATIMEFTLIDV